MIFTLELRVPSAEVHGLKMLLKRMKRDHNISCLRLAPRPEAPLPDDGSPDPDTPATFPICD